MLFAYFISIQSPPPASTSPQQEFNQQAASATDLDELIVAHERYLSTLLRKVGEGMTCSLPGVLAYPCPSPQ